MSNPPLTVALVVGQPLETDGTDPLHCGVRDYANCLARALSECGVTAQVVAPPRWTLCNGLPWMRDVRQSRPDVVHLQYPSIGHRTSLLPHLLGWSRVGSSCVVTLHEHSALPRVQRMANQLFRAGAKQLIFTTAYEARTFGATAASLVIPIGSNVPVHPNQPERDNTVLYFGQIRPHKGIEGFIALAARSAAEDGPWRFVIIGSAPPRWLDYRHALQESAPATLRWIDDAPLPAVATMMATAMAAYLPFPDGAGLRRGSLLAALANGLPVIAPFGPSTPDDLRAVLLPADTPALAMGQLQVLSARPDVAARHGANGRALMHRRSWSAIAQQHVALYRRLQDARGPSLRYNKPKVSG